MYEFFSIFKDYTHKYMCSFHGSNLKVVVTILVSLEIFKRVKRLKKKYLYISANFECRAVVTVMVNSENSLTKWSVHVVSFTLGLSFYVTIVNVCLFLKKIKPYRIVKFTFLCLPTPCFSRGCLLSVVWYLSFHVLPSTVQTYVHVCMYATLVC